MGSLAPQLGSVATIPLARFELGDTVVVSRFGREAKITSRTYTLPIRYEARCLASGAYIRDLSADDMVLADSAQVGTCCEAGVTVASQLWRWGKGSNPPPHPARFRSPSPGGRKTYLKVKIRSLAEEARRI